MKKIKVLATLFFIVVSVNHASAQSASSNSPICVGQTIQLSSSGGTTYAWSGPNSFSSTLQNPSITNATTGNGGTYWVTITGSGTYSRSVDVIVSPSVPAPSALSNSPICVGYVLNLSSNGGASGGVTYIWSGPNNFSATGQSLSVGGSISAGTYSVTVTNGCGSASSNTSVSVLPSPSVSSSSNSPLCAGSTLNLSSTATGAISYSWTGPNGFSSTQQNTSITSTTVANTGTYTVTVTGSNGCTAHSNQFASISQPSTPSVTLGCVGNNLQLASSGGAHYSWTGPNGFSSTLQSPYLTNLTLASAGTYSVTVTGVCPATTLTNQVTINSGPPVAVATSNSPVCPGSTLFLSASGGVTYNWSGPNSFFSTLQYPTISNVSQANAGQYGVNMYNGCGGNSATASVTINTFYAYTSSPRCAGTTINFTSNGGGTYNWTGPNGFSSTQQNPAIVNCIVANAGTYSLIITAANGCSASFTMPVTVYPAPTATIASNNSPVCTGSTIMLSGGGNYRSYYWNEPNGFGSSAQYLTIQNSTVQNSGTYTLTVSDTNFCSSTPVFTNVTIYTTFPNAVASSNSPLCTGSALYLSSSGGVSYRWIGPNGYSSLVQNPNVAPVTTTYMGTYSVIVTGSNGCSSTASTTVSIDPTVTWTQKPNFPLYLIRAASFTIGKKGYVGTGGNSYVNGTVYKSFFEYDQATNVWTQKADFGGIGRIDATGFSIGTKGYIGLGDALPRGSGSYHDMWEWDQATNVWTQKAAYPGLGTDGSSFTIGNKGYYFGTLLSGYIPTSTEFYEWDQATNSWTQKANFPGEKRELPVAFSIGNKGYIGAGVDTAGLKDFWEWNQNTNTWSRKADFGGPPITWATGFSILNKGFIGIGSDSCYCNDFWEWDQLTNVWVRKANLQRTQNSSNYSDVAFALGTKGYVGPALNDTTFWEYNAFPVNLNLKFFTQGYYLNGGTMRKVLYNEAAVTNSGLNFVDTVVVELHNTTSPYAVAESFKWFVNADGTMPCAFSCNALGNSYYIAIKHRNSIQTWSATPVTMTATTSYDFTTAANKAYGNNMVQLQAGVWAFYTGDINQDENVDLLDFPSLDFGINRGLTGYYAADLNGDGNVDLLDFPMFDTNVNVGIYSVHP